MGHGMEEGIVMVFGLDWVEFGDDTTFAAGIGKYGNTLWKQMDGVWGFDSRMGYMDIDLDGYFTYLLPSC